jgi:hypothetical protein
MIESVGDLKQIATTRLWTGTKIYVFLKYALRKIANVSDFVKRIACMYEWTLT